MAEIILKPFLKTGGEFIVLSRQIKEAVKIFSQVIIKARDNNAFEIFFDFFRSIFTHGANETIYKQNRLDDLNVEHPWARSRMSPSCESLKATGSLVPHLRLAKTFMLVRYTSARSGLVMAQGRARIFVRTGILAVFRV